MHRIFQNPSLQLHKFYLSPIKTSANNPAPKNSLQCVFLCENLRSHCKFQIRYFSSTTDNLLLNSLNKKRFKIRKKDFKKYAELLEVTKSSSSTKKASVQNLNATQLSILVDQPDINLDELHKIQERQILKKKYDNEIDRTTSSSLKENGIANLNADKYVEEELMEEDMQHSNILDKTDIIKYASLAESLENVHKESILEEEVDEKKDEGLIKDFAEKEKLAREKAIAQEKTKLFNKALTSYLSVCINAGLLDEASSKIRNCKKYRRQSLFHINNASPFNVVIERYAYKADYKKISNIIQLMRKDGTALDPQTYVYIFDCIGRMSDSNNKIELLKKVYQDMEKDKVTLNDILTKTIYLRDQRPHVEKMVKLLNKKFQPVYEVPNVKYDLGLLNDLNIDPGSPKSTTEDLITIKNLEELLQRQIQAEIDGQVTVKSIAKKTASENSLEHWRKKLSNLEKCWEKTALEAFRRNLQSLRTRELYQGKTSFYLFPYLSVLKPEDYIRIIMQQVQKLGMGSEMYSLPYNTLCRSMGMQVEKLYEAKMKEKYGIIKKISEVYLQYSEWFITKNEKVNPRSKWTMLEHEANKHGVTLNAIIPSWQVHAHSNIGKFLFDIIINDLKLNVNYFAKKPKNDHYISGFFKIFRHNGMKLIEEIKPHPVVSKLYRDAQLDTLTFDTTLVPSLCPPKPWVSIHQGGYIVTKSDIVRMGPFSTVQWERLATTAANKLYPALDSLNQLGSVPWEINTKVLDIAIKVFQNDGSVKLNMPQPPSVLPPLQPVLKDATNEEKRKAIRTKMELKRRKNEMYSLWCDALYRLSLANHFRDKIFWLPHNMDFRGRVYPVPPHLNHLGSDLARSMLMFALKKPLGPNGLEWLKLHIVNLTGFKKRDPIKERIKYANENLEKILDSAEKPLDGQMWWSKSDDPWQTLAACMELSQALKSPSPEKYMTGFPIHQDGSCNGLQHYAALGRDKIGARSVNLEPCEVPQDVYSSVAAMVEELRQKDAENDLPVARMLEGFVKRKTIKQTVMTTVYGVTWFGAKLQVARRLKDEDNFPQQHVFAASNYLVEKTFETLRTMFTSAKEIQDWFTECSRLICQLRLQNMEWITPMNLPVVQPYSKVYKSLNQKIATPFFAPDIYIKPNVVKQKNAFPPNYVHSLDSSHMMLTSIRTEHQGITFVSVHDCYWTHPCTVEIMNKICREQFVALHSEPILEDLSKFLLERFGYRESEFSNDADSEIVMKKKLNATITKVPKPGNFDLKQVLDSIYFFS